MREKVTASKQRLMSIQDPQMFGNGFVYVDGDFVIQRQDPSFHLVVGFEFGQVVLRVTKVAGSRVQGVSALGVAAVGSRVRRVIDFLAFGIVVFAMDDLEPAPKEADRLDR